MSTWYQGEGVEQSLVVTNQEKPESEEETIVQQPKELWLALHVCGFKGRLSMYYLFGPLMCYNRCAPVKEPAATNMSFPSHQGSKRNSENPHRSKFENLVDVPFYVQVTHRTLAIISFPGVRLSGECNYTKYCKAMAYIKELS